MGCSPRIFEVVVNKDRAKQGDTTRDRDEINVYPPGWTNADAGRIVRPIGAFNKSGPRLQFMGYLRRDLVRWDQNFSKIDFDPATNWIWHVGRPPTNWQH